MYNKISAAVFMWFYNLFFSLWGSPLFMLCQFHKRQMDIIIIINSFKFMYCTISDVIHRVLNRSSLSGSALSSFVAFPPRSPLGLLFAYFAVCIFLSPVLVLRAPFGNPSSELFRPKRERKNFYPPIQTKILVKHCNKTFCFSRKQNSSQYKIIIGYIYISVILKSS